MKVILKITLFALIITGFGCSENSEIPVNNIEEVEVPITGGEAGESFLPMHIGNYWKNNDDNYTEIIDSLRIQGDLYFKFHSLIGGDGILIQYLRIDNDQNLISTHPDYPDSKSIQAKFNASLGSRFWTRNDQTVNDFRVTVIEKEDTLRTFEFQMVYHPILRGTHRKTYIRGLGWNNYNQIKIDGNIYTIER